MKVCARCGVVKDATDFRKDSRYADGLGSWCIECHRERNSEWARENRKRLTEKSAAYRAQHREAARASNRKCKQANRDRYASNHQAWAASNKDKRRATWAAHKAAKLRATPKWADFSAIANVYRLAAEAEKLTGVRMHVDHIVPLQHQLVCGLHVAENLQILPGAFNEAKRNHWPLPPHLQLFIERPAPAKQEAFNV